MRFIKYSILLFILPLPLFAFQVKTVAYQGNAADDREIFVGWKPDLCWITGNNGQSDKARTASHSGDASFSFRRNMANSADYIQSFTTRGFTVGTQAGVNSAGVDYIAACFRDNGDGDFKYGTYTGNGSDNRNIEIDSNFTPIMMVIKNGDGTDTGAWRVAPFSGDATSQFHEFGSLNANVIQSFYKNGFQVGTAGDVNTSAQTYYYIAWRASPGIAYGTYTGDASDNRNIKALPWKPEVMWVKDPTSNPVVEKSIAITGENTSVHTFSAFLATDRIQLLGGKTPYYFQVGTDSDVNETSTTMYWVAWRSSEQVLIN